MNDISIHALLAESDPLIALFDFPIVPVISIHALLAESDVKFKLDFVNQKKFLSTLSLRRATTHQKNPSKLANFYPRSPCGERRQNPGKHYVAFRFLSTLSLRRATYDGLIASANFCNFYPRSPCGERRWLIHRMLKPLQISIHALLAESDLAGPSGPAFLYRFLSTLSLRRATTS